MAQSQRGIDTQASGGWYGWIVFAGTMMIITGAFNVIQSLVALADDEFYVVTPNHLVTFDLTQWGWIHLIMGIVLILVGLALFKESMWAVITGIIIVSLNMISQFAFMSAYPVWSIVAIAVDLMVLWALIVHGGESAD
ncbi:MAG TPA: hypothetical protein VIH06_12150 [Ilumatobacteraceae bacterium]